MLPLPTVLSARVDHERTIFWDAIVNVTGITTQLFNDFLTSLAPRYKQTYIASHGDIVKMLMTYLINEQMLPKQFLIKTKVIRPRESTRYCFTEPEVRRILRHCLETVELQWLHPLLAILAYTGMRISEVLMLRWNDLNFPQSEIDLTDERFDAARLRTGNVRRLKGRKSRRIPLHNELANVLRSLPRIADGHIIHLPDGKRPKYDDVFVPFVREVLVPLASEFPKAEGAETGFVDGRFHSFRHFFCSVAHDLGLSEH